MSGRRADEKTAREGSSPSAVPACSQSSELNSSHSFILLSIGLFVALTTLSLGELNSQRSGSRGTSQCEAALTPRYSKCVCFCERLDLPSRVCGCFIYDIGLCVSTEYYV